MAAAENLNNNFCYFYEYLLNEDLETTMEVNYKEFKHIPASLIYALKTQLQPCSKLSALYLILNHIRHNLRPGKSNRGAF